MATLAASHSTHQRTLFGTALSINIIRYAACRGIAGVPQPKARHSKGERPTNVNEPVWLIETKPACVRRFSGSLHRKRHTSACS